ncbi:UDP-N-acetylmuramoyl-L-alanine--D-glutamate ligase [Sporanaerobium hydrogeniformans]|uniref:UDP-N-acetylmuramoyl-L-alanine--D-glutamate ligase n=1 Tax=Sporanaerobium hydrogeniformans TaxID=3072179 RepID=A0AC61DEE2_9FIRM|nr:UDP-N-acetylmuramoyl-L-alanine--D-glutamate ligase [Sporanaerobium hydrogeniformans]PHV71091.1 UDP-N-acetylmuramoyl-L-alanine--D-glutamate ligase [Sporanaerobium hydrogeniformans]
MDVKGKSILIIGNARSGIAAAKLALNQGAQVWIYDGKAYEKWNEEIQKHIQEMKKQGIGFILGEEPELENIDLVIMSPGVPLDIPCVKKAKTKGIEVIGELEFASRFCKAPIVAITGTNGKTTTTTLVGEIMKSYNPQTFVVGNIGRAFSEDVLTIPTDGIVVAEVSSFQLETAPTFHPVVSAILNITPDHLNRHHTMENYCACKYQILANQNTSDFCVLNSQDTYFKEAKEKAKGQVITFSLKEENLSSVFLQDGKLIENILGEKNSICEVNELKIKGTHNIENAAAAIAICRAFGVPISCIREALLAFKGVEHRTEYVTTKKGIDFFNDSKATNTDAAIAGLMGLSVLGKPIRLIAGGMDKEISFRPWTKLFKGRVAKVYIIGETKEQLMKECEEEGYYNYQGFITFEEAIHAAYRESQSGECVLLSPACASWDMFESYEQRGELFKEIVNHLEG